VECPLHNDSKELKWCQSNNDASDCVLRALICHLTLVEDSTFLHKTEEDYDNEDNRNNQEWIVDSSQITNVPRTASLLIFIGEHWVSWFSRILRANIHTFTIVDECWCSALKTLIYIINVAKITSLVTCETREVLGFRS
jgi:hypothetical protein